MKSLVEARSLSSLTNLFANPPQYPRNPTHEAREPLVLYIVRVPGSKDVFLTPLKPPTKASISVEAIQASLYYLHVESPEDEAVREALGGQEQQAGVEPSETAPPIHRKPLPPSLLTNSLSTERHLSLQQDYAPAPPPHAVAFHDIHRGWPAAADQYDHLDLPSDAGPGNIARKPLGPRPIHSRLQPMDSEAPPRKPVGISIATRETPSKTLDALHRSSVPTAIIGEIGGADDHISFTDHDSVTSLDFTFADPVMMPDIRSGHSISSAQEPAESLEERPPAEESSAFGITLIRRDPSSGSQWNIGNIYRNATSSDLDSIKIELSTPGYQKFNKYVDPRPSLDVDFARGDAASIKSFIASGRVSPSSRSTTTTATRFFTREVRPLQSRSPTRVQQHQSSDDLSPDAILRKLSPPRAKARNQHYTFTSPWHGDCEFSTGMNGRSLKCRHTLPAASPEQVGVSATVAELRFNLPWSALKTKDHQINSTRHLKHTPISKVFRPDTKDAWKHGMQKLKEKGLNRGAADYNNGGNDHAGHDHQPHHYASKEPDWHSHSEDDGRLDLKLGREKAGGGRKGKSAKLGKLIIEDEGLKMCDLVVAGCMGVWWRYYAG